MNTSSASRSARILPRPLHMEKLPGEFVLNAESFITWQGDGSEDLAHLLSEYLRPPTGFQFPVEAAGQRRDGGIHLVCRQRTTADNGDFPGEKYSCEVSPSEIVIEADLSAGLARAIQTLRQLFPEHIFSENVQPGPWAIPCVRIEDEPRFRWRGMHLDVARHFFSVDEVCRYIDLLALHRFNHCHLHLTDDQGWRIEIKKYPRLTAVGSVRNQTLIGHEMERPRRYDGCPYGGFFTQDEMKTIVAFAARRMVTVVPEIEMPGHAQAAISAYPELGCVPRPEVRCHWGISQHVLNVDESTLSFCRDVLDEVMEIFPSKFIHVGGDEAPKFEWSESPGVQARMAALGIKGENELQSWFIGQMVGHLSAHGRRLIGWDEILEGGLPPGATVMSWRGEEGGLKAASAGHDVIMAPCQWVYFDHYQAEPVREEPLGFYGTISTEHVYGYEPVPSDLSKEHAHHILGAQGQLWSEYIPNVDHLYYMAYPRTCALAEVLWLPSEELRYPRFLEDLHHHRKRLAVLGVRAHPRP